MLGFFFYLFMFSVPKPFSSNGQDHYEMYPVVLATYTKFCHRGLCNDDLLLIAI